MKDDIDGRLVTLRQQVDCYRVNTEQTRAHAERIPLPRQIWSGFWSSDTVFGSADHASRSQWLPKFTGTFLFKDTLKSVMKIRSFFRRYEMSQIAEKCPVTLGMLKNRSNFIDPNPDADKFLHLISFFHRCSSSNSFHEDPISSFHVRLLTDRQTDRHADRQTDKQTDKRWVYLPHWWSKISTGLR